MVFIRNMCIGGGFIVAAPIVAIVVGHLLAAYIPIDDPLFYGESIEHYLTEVYKVKIQQNARRRRRFLRKF